MIPIIVVGITMVFLIFVILYFIFVFMGWVFTRRPKVQPSGPTVRVVEERDEEVVAVISAVLHLMLGKTFEIKKVRRVEDTGFVYWIRTGWRGVRRWRGSSRLP